jgi:hypothetical protein
MMPIKLFPLLTPGAQHSESKDLRLLPKRVATPRILASGYAHRL